MRASLAFDPQDYDYGPATEAVRSILLEWIEIDWFEPRELGGEHAARLFREHQRLAHMHVPELFPEQIDVRVVSGGRSDFASWCERVRAQTSWDWKFSVLKTLSNQHARACGWSPASYVERMPVATPRPGDPFCVFATPDGEKQWVWNNLVATPKALDALPRGDELGEAAKFYIGYAMNDALECMKWQFAESSADLSNNPFLPLLLCYEAGGYPFSLGADTVVLFTFEEHPHASA